MYVLGGALLLPALLSVTCPKTGCMASAAAASAEMSGGPTGRSSAFLRSLQSEPVSSSEQCPPCPACECNAKGVFEEVPKETIEPITVQILMLDSQGIIDMVEWNAKDYERFTGGRVKVEIKRAPSMPALFEEIENDARSGGGLFDAYYTNPTILGTAAMLDGFMDLTEYVKSNPYADWTDVLLALRTYVTSFEDKIYLVLLDGDTHTLFYRKDVLEAFGLDVPRTWNEYNEVAKAVHGKMCEYCHEIMATKLTYMYVRALYLAHNYFIPIYFHHMYFSQWNQASWVLCESHPGRPCNLLDASRIVVHHPDRRNVHWLSL